MDDATLFGGHSRTRSCDGLTLARPFVRLQKRFASVPLVLDEVEGSRRETGGVAPGKIGGHKKPVLSGVDADWLRERIARGHSLCAS